MEDDLPFRTEYAKSDRSSCNECKSKIANGTLRLAVVSQAATFDRKIPSWYHFDCFFESQRPKSAGDIAHFDQLRWKDQEKINEKISEKINDKEVLLKKLPALPVQKRKIEDTVDGDGSSSAKKRKRKENQNEQQSEEIKKRNKIRFKYKDQLKTLTKQELQVMLEYNDQQIPSGTSEILDHLSDVMTFGALLPCLECKTGQLYYKSGVGYQCSENIGGWAECSHITTAPERKAFKVPPELAEKYSFLEKYKYVARQRVIPALTRTIQKETTDEVNVEIQNSSNPQKLKLNLKGGGVVDPGSGLADEAHVLKTKDCLYSVVLGIVDIQKGRNSYYKLQVLEHDEGNKWYVFRSWGRVGTLIGNTKLTEMESKQEAIEDFVALYEEKTGNSWKNRHNFEKQPGKLYPLHIDYGEVETTANSTSKLQKSVQDLICMLFDEEAMKRTLIEFELDLTKMPLGKLSKKQLEKAYGILSQAQELLDSKEVSKTKLVDVSNQFYTLIPHDFGRKTPPVLDNCEIIKSKLDMLESLMEIEVAFNLLKTGDAVKDKNPIDAHYEKLNTEIEVLDKSSEEFKLIETYAKNTHGATHTRYTLEVEEVFKVVRKDESERFQPFSKWHNRRLLWHGSRLANVVGILSHGLRIAPPEADVSGYMFGKGIYFADMVSKSANYCFTSKSNPVGLLLLCDVALGKCDERRKACNIKKLEEGYQSVLGVGKTEPNPEESKMMGDVKVPLGKPIPTKVKNTSLLYNEYIVYDVAQVNIKYLVKTKFHYK
ncbi:poly [ADP-ribose] polymerase 1-like [Daphnia carinata]|uniref:poly [ADP-ribose] polymerase 1-like n=1 Tax=Daphnia carinata TaxID=120202 RepID=UPI00257E3688|nr:poly [ADP-ribose] polymerase 1-like [Daphnia carinata]